MSGSTCCQAGVRRLPPFHDVAAAYPCQTTNSMTLPATLSGFRLTHPAGPMRRLSESLGPRGPDVDAEREKTATHPAPCTCHRLHDGVFQHSELLRIATSVAQGRKGVSQSPERKNPGGALRGHQPGFSWDPREVPGRSGNLPDMSCEGYVIPFPFQLFSGR